MVKWLTVCSALLVAGGSVSSVDRPSLSEDEWVAELIASGDLSGEPQHRLPDGTRVDLLTPDVAYEVEWCDRTKVYEAFGQAIYYASSTNRDPGVILLRRRGDEKSEKAYMMALVMRQYLGRGCHLKVIEVGQ